MSRNGAYARSASRSGRHGGWFQSWPVWLNASGGAPTVMPRANTSCRRPGVGAVRMHADREVVHDAQRHARPDAAACAPASCSSSTHCSQR